MLPAPSRARLWLLGSAQGSEPRRETFLSAISSGPRSHLASFPEIINPEGMIHRVLGLCLGSIGACSAPCVPLLPSPTSGGILVEPPARAATLGHGSLSTAQRHPPERDPMDTSGGWLHPTAGTCWGSTGIHRAGSTGKRGRAALGTLCFGAGHWCLQEAGVWGEPAWCRKVPV